MNAMATGIGALAVLAVTGGAASAGAGEPRVLPTFKVTALDGTVVEREAVVKSGRWLLAYVRAQSGPSRTLLGALEKARAETAATVTIVVGGNAAAAKALADDFPGLKLATWYVDAREETFKALRLTGVPVVMGMQENDIEWSILGIVPDRKTLPSVLSSW